MKKFLITEKQLKFIIDNFDLLNEQVEKPETEVNKYCKYFKDKENKEYYNCSLLLNYPDNIIQPYTTNKTILPELDKFINSVKLLINSKFEVNDKFIVSVEAGASTPCATASLKPGYDDKTFLHGFGKNIKQSVGGSRDCIENGNEYLAEQRQKFMIKLLSKQLGLNIKEGETKTNDSKYSKINILLTKKSKVPVPETDKFRWDYFKINRMYPNGPLNYTYLDIVKNASSWTTVGSGEWVRKIVEFGLIKGSKQTKDERGNIVFSYPADLKNYDVIGNEIEKYFNNQKTYLKSGKENELYGKKLYDILNTQIPSLQGKLLDNPPLQVDRVIKNK